MSEPRIAIIGYGRKSKTLAETILSETIRNSEEMKLLQAYLDTRLIPEEIIDLQRKYNEDEHEYCGEYGTDECQFKNKLDTLQKQLDVYRELEEQGLLIKLPCKVGDKVYRIQSVNGCQPDYHCAPYNHCSHCVTGHTYKNVIREWKFALEYYELIGKTVFLTKEAAEEALRKGCGEE